MHQQPTNSERRNTPRSSEPDGASEPGLSAESLPRPKPGVQADRASDQQDSVTPPSRVEPERAARRTTPSGKIAKRVQEPEHQFTIRPDDLAQNTSSSSAAPTQPEQKHGTIPAAVCLNAASSAFWLVAATCWFGSGHLALGVMDVGLAVLYASIAIMNYHSRAR